MADNLGYTPGAGSLIRTSQGSSSGAHMQIFKLSTGTAGDETFVPASAANGLTCDVTRVQGVVIVNNPTAANLKVDASGVAVPITDNSGSLTVDAPAATPVAVRLSTGSAFIDTIPVSIAGTVTVSGTVAISGSIAATQSGTWNIATLTTITNPVTVTGSVTISGTSPVSGTVTANQGTAAVIGNAWVTKITDGVHAVGVTTLSGPVYALKVDVVQQVGGGYSQQDRTAFTDGTTFCEVVGGVFNDAATAPGAGQAGYLRMTSFRGAHVNIRRNADGAELGISATPLRVDPTGTTTQPVNGTVTVNQGATAWVGNLTQTNGHTLIEAANGIQKVGISDATGTTFSDANPLSVAIAPRTGKWRVHVTLASSQTNTAVHTPAGGKTVFVEGFIVSVTTPDVFTLSDGNASDSTDLYKGTPIAGTVTQNYPRPEPLAAVNDVLRYSSGGSLAGDLTVWGYEA